MIVLSSLSTCYQRFNIVLKSYVIYNYKLQDLPYNNLLKNVNSPVKVIVIY